LPVLRDRHFGFAEVTESAFRTVRATAQAAGVTAQVTAAGITTGKLIGFAEHIHQLITLLAVSPLNLKTGVLALDLRVEMVPENSTFAKMTVRVAFSADNQAQALLAHLNSVTAAAATLQSGEFTEAEFGLAAGWQLAQALGAQSAIEAVNSHEVRLSVSFLIETESVPAATPDPVDLAPSRNGNGHHVHGHAAKNNHRNGNHSEKSPAGVESSELQPATPLNH
jgi:hypothetical protein